MCGIFSYEIFSYIESKATQLFSGGAQILKQIFWNIFKNGSFSQGRPCQQISFPSKAYTYLKKTLYQKQKKIFFGLKLKIAILKIINLAKPNIGMLNILCLISKYWYLTIFIYLTLLNDSFGPLLIDIIRYS